jgi:hypothetical protein
MGKRLRRPARAAGGAGQSRVRNGHQRTRRRGLRGPKIEASHSAIGQLRDRPHGSGRHSLSLAFDPIGREDSVAGAEALVTRHEAASAAGVTYNTILLWIRAGRLHPVEVGGTGRRVIRLPELESALARGAGLRREEGVWSRVFISGAGRCYHATPLCSLLKWGQGKERGRVVTKIVCVSMAEARERGRKACHGCVPRPGI